MVYNISIKMRAVKALQKIDEPYYSSIKQAIYNLTKHPRPNGYKKLVNRDGY